MCVIKKVVLKETMKLNRYIKIKIVELLRPSWYNKQRFVYPYIFILPFFIIFGRFLIWPIFYSVYMSLYKWEGINPGHFIGINNYLLLLSDEVFRTSIYNTMYYVIGTTFLQLPLALLLAVTMNSVLTKGKLVFRTGFFLPVISSTVVISIVFFLIYDYRAGVLNYVLESVGLPTINWLGNKSWVMFSIVIVGIWRWTGFNMLYFLAGLQSVPRELYEAAKIDGTNKWQTFWYITLPSLWPIVGFIVIMHMIGAWQEFDTPYLLTQGGPGFSSTTMALYLFNSGFGYFKLGYASCIGYSLFLIILVISIIQLRIFGIFKGTK